MPPFLQFRLWLRRAPTQERLVAACLAVVVLVVASWSLVSVGGSDNPGSAAAVDAGGSHQVAGGTSRGGPAGGATPSSAGRRRTGNGKGSGIGTGGSGGPSAVAAGGGRSASSRPTSPGASHPHSPRPTTASTPGCGPRTSTDQGVTATQIHIDVDVANLAGQAGNNLVGLPSANIERQMFAAAIAAVNKAGGVRCRTLVAKYYSANPLLTPSLQGLCLNMVADKPFAILDEGLASPVGSPAPRDCPPAHKVPEFGSLPMSRNEVTHYAPYLFGDYPVAEETVHNSILGAKALGWFNGAKKIGLLEQECIPDLNQIALTDLASIGYPKSKVVTFDFGCPNDIPSPLVVQNAVLRFKTAGVTNVLDDGGVYENYFANQAHNQRYKPKYSVGDQGSIALWDNRAFGPNPDNFANALAITGAQYGAENTPGMSFNTATRKCNQAMAAKHLAGATTSPDGFAGVACTLVTMFVNAANNAPSLRRDQLAAGLASVGRLDLPFPGGLADFAASDGQVGGGYWRADRWNTGCACFRVWKPAWQRSYR